MNFLKYFSCIIAFFCLTGCFSANINLRKDSSEPLIEFTIEGKGEQKILIIPVTGVISSKPEKGFLSYRSSMVQSVLAQLKKAKTDPDIKAVILKVDSPGGTVTASDILYNEIKNFRKDTKKPIVVSILNVGASGAYYLSLPADKIFAHPTSVVGSVGVIFIRPKVHELMGKIGVDVAVTKSGIKKDMGSPFKKVSEEEIKFSQELTDKLAARFFSLVDKHRKLTPQAFAEIKTAGVYLPEEAKSLGIIDGIGYLSDAVLEAKKLAKATEPVSIITYRRNQFANDTLYNSAGAFTGKESISAINLNIPGLSSNAGFYYLSPLFSGM